MKPGYHQHLFICTNGGNKEGKCASRGAEDLRIQVKERLKDLAPGVRVNASGCLGYCENGIAAVLYPEGKWFLGLTKESADFLVNQVTTAIKSDQP